MLQLLTTDEFAQWFRALDDRAAEDVAGVLDVVEQLGPTRALPGSRESLLWYEHSSVSTLDLSHRLAWELEDWGAFRDYAWQLLRSLESPRFAARLNRLPYDDAAKVLRAIQRIKAAADPRLRWSLKLHGDRRGRSSNDARAEDARAELRTLYFAALEAAGLPGLDVPAHSRALREFARRVAAPPYRLLYGVNIAAETALFVVGEHLERSFYGDTVRHAERVWKQFLDGDLQAVQPAALR